MNKQCIAFVTDENFFLPTFVAANLAKKHCQNETDVIIISTERFDKNEIAEKLCNESGVIFSDKSDFFANQLSLLNKSSFNGRISPAAMGRLLLPSVLSECYEQIIYLDGDVQVINSLKSLEDFYVPEGKFLAALDYVQIKSILEEKEYENYFNSGVLKFHRNGWIGRKAFDYFLNNDGVVYHDQGALNAVKENSLIIISNKWNFPRQFMHLVGDHKPSIIHYMSHPKPWDGVFFPWGKGEYEVYVRYIKKYPQLKSFKKNISLARKVIYRFRSVKMKNRNEFSDRAEKLKELLY